MPDIAIVGLAIEIAFEQQAKIRPRIEYPPRRYVISQGNRDREIRSLVFRHHMSGPGALHIASVVGRHFHVIVLHVGARLHPFVLQAQCDIESEGRLCEALMYHSVDRKIEQRVIPLDFANRPRHWERRSSAQCGACTDRNVPTFECGANQVVIRVSRIAFRLRWGAYLERIYRLG